ncbi:MAG: hypothetical protein ACO329_03420 [Steroidobacteraceae bacterium]
MNICQSHNLRSAPVSQNKPFGLRVSLKPGDPFAKLLGADWSRTHWYSSAAERDAAMLEMSRKHEYSRPGDFPAHVYERVVNLAAR